MLTDRGSSTPFSCRRDPSGVALVITLALLVLVTVTIVAFFSRTTTNQQITTGSSQGVATTTFADGATQDVIGGLQKEMWDVSGQPTPAASPSPAPIIFPMTNVAGINPSRMVGPNVPIFPTLGSNVDPNASYAKFANLVKQSYRGVATYSGGTATASKPTSAISTSTPAIGGRAHDGIYWNQPQLVSISSSSSTASSDLAPLVPDWIYADRSSTHPTTYASNMGATGNGALTPTSILGRYAYNIYDLGGLLNANVAGYGTIAPIQPTNTTPDTLIVPGYKGSALMADLSGLALGGNLTINGASVSSISNLQATLSAFRYRQSGPNAFAMLFGSGQYGGWLQPFLTAFDPGALSGTPNSSTLLTNYGFTSRQDLITWINSQFPAATTGGSSPTAWVLPYLTHFSYDTDAPTYTPSSTRPQDTATVASGGNDAVNLDPVINPGFNSPTTTNNPTLSVCDTNGYPLVKRRFPLSVLSLFNNIYPGSPPASQAISDQIKYDFGLVWEPAGNCWDYQDQNGGTAIKKLSDIAAITPSRSPNFFELLKAAITAGSLGKQWGEAYSNDPNFVLGGSRSSTINFQILQIGANIISQSTTNYYPTDIRYTDNGNDIHFYGIKDLPYLYRSRVLHGTVGDYSTTAPAKGHMHNVGSNTPGYSKLGAIVLQPELWNPHAANALPLPGAAYPTAFRVVAITYNTTAIRTYEGKLSGIAWEKADGTNNANALSSIVYGDFSGAGGPNLTNQPSYSGGTNPNAYIQFSPAAPSVSANALNTYREPIPLAAPGFPDGSVTSFPINPTLAVGTANWDGKLNTQVIVTTSGSTIPAVFSSAPASNKLLGFLMGYYCGGPGSTSGGAVSGYVLSVSQVNTIPGALTTGLQLQYGINGNFYPYDNMTCAIPTANNNGSYNIGNGAQQTEVGTRIDPRTQRWGNAWARLSAGNAGPYGTASVGTLYPGLTGTTGIDLTTNQGKLANAPGAPNWTLASSPPFGWLQINPGPGTPSYQAGTGSYYADPDGVYRPADDAYGANGNAIGLPEAMVGPVTGSATPTAASSYDSRPVVLNRAFQSVAELGYVFRDIPWRSLDFINPQSGDSALLDVFCVYGPDPWSYAAHSYNNANIDPSTTVTTYLATSGLASGRVNLNTRQAPVLAALLKGAAVTTPTSNPSSLTVLNDAQSTTIAESLVGWTTASDTTNKGPLRNPAELVGKFVGSVGSTYTYSGFSSTLTAALGGQGTSAATIKQQRECVMHALGDSGTTRTWNLLIDLVAQTGQLSPKRGDGGVGELCRQW